MTDKQEIGRRGEELAIRFLEEEQYEILETNWRFSRAEIDIIARKNEVLVFVEVKTRSSDTFGNPELAVTRHKEKQIADAAAAYMRSINHEWEIRFDIIALIIHNEQEYQLEHFPDAFFPSF